MRFAVLSRVNAPPIHVRLDASDVATPLDGPGWLGGAVRGGALAWKEEDLLCPVAPSKIVCIGRNYAAHAKELGNEPPAEPLLFLKPPSSLLAPRRTIALPAASARVEHEAELGVVIGKRASRVSRANALAHVFGYTCVNDVTARDLQKKDGQWTRAKGFDSFCPAGPWIETELDPSKLRVVCRVNGQERQNGVTADMIFDVPTLIEYVSHVMTLEPGDLISTGTPEGVGPLVDGDEVEVLVTSASAGGPGIGALRERVAKPVDRATG